LKYTFPIKLSKEYPVVPASEKPTYQHEFACNYV